MKYIFLFSIFFLTNISFAQTDTINRFIVTEKVNKLLEERYHCSLNEKVKSKNYHIQIYNGYNLNKAKNIKQEFLNKFPEIPVVIEWENPEFKVWIGIYENKLSADRALMHIRKDYPNAFIVNPKDR